MLVSSTKMARFDRLLQDLSHCRTHISNSEHSNCIDVVLYSDANENY